MSTGDKKEGRREKRKKMREEGEREGLKEEMMKAEGSYRERGKMRHAKQKGKRLETR